jgi:hypothetical protein
MPRIYRIGGPLSIDQAAFAVQLVRISSIGYIAKLACTASKCFWMKQRQICG